MLIRPASLQDLAPIIAMITDEDRVLDPNSIQPGDDYVRAFRAIEEDPRNEMLVLEDGDHSVIGYLQITYIPGLGQGGRDRALLEAIRIRADQRGSGKGRHLVAYAIERARERGCGLVQVMSNKRRDRSHRFYASLGFTRSHDGFKLGL